MLVNDGYCRVSVSDQAFDFARRQRQNGSRCFMYRTGFDPWSECWKLFSGFMCCGSRRHYTRKERIDQLEKLKKNLQDEIAGIDELIQDLKKHEAK